MKFKIGLIVSNNGLGHINRSLYLIKILAKEKNFDVTLCCDKDKIPNVKKLKKIKIYNLKFNNQSSKFFLKKKIHKYLKIKKKFDILLSDNYPEVSYNKENTLHLSNFFWHNILKINTNYYRKLEKKILKRPIIPNYLFVSKYIKKKFKIIPVGFYGKFMLRKFIPNKKCILISFGTAKNKRDNSIKKFINNLKHRNDNFKIFLEPAYFYKDLEKYNIFEAKFTSKMFCKIGIAIIKPGLGTIRDCLSYGLSILTYTRLQNNEFLYNAKVLEENKLAVNFNNLNSAYVLASTLINNNKYSKNSFNLAKNLRWQGEYKVLGILKRYFKDKVILAN